MGLVECSFFRCCPEKVIKAIIDRHVMFAGVHRFRQLRPSGAQPISHLTPHLTGGRAAGPIESLAARGDRDAVPAA